MALVARLDVDVAAPMWECSRAGVSIAARSADGRFVVERRSPGGEGNGSAEPSDVFAVEGLPAFIALTAMRGAFHRRMS